MKLELLNDKIRVSGLKKNYIAEQMGIDRVSLYNKLAGKTEFTVTEIISLCDILKLNDKDKKQIFLQKNMN